MGDPHDHDHHHLPEDLPAQEMNVLRRVFALTCIYLAIEIIGGWWTGSLALLADGFHMFADATAIGIALFAAWFAHRPAPPQRTFGYARIEIMAAFFNGLLLVAMALFILLESSERFFQPRAIEADWMTLIAGGGLIVNLIAARLLHGHHHGNLNLKGAYFHVLGDLLGSIGAMVAGLLILFFGWSWVDASIGMLIAGLVLLSALSLLKDAYNVLLEGCPANVDVETLRQALLGHDGVQNVHELHVWHINLQRTVLTAHLEVRPDAYRGETLTAIQDLLKTRFGLSHVTLQMEIGDVDSPPP